MENNVIRVKVNGGCLVAGRNADPNYDGIYIVFETDDKETLNIVTTECKAQNDYNKIDVYCYEDIHDEGFTRKYTIDNAEVYNVLNEYKIEL